MFFYPHFSFGMSSSTEAPLHNLNNPQGLTANGRQVAQFPRLEPVSIDGSPGQAIVNYDRMQPFLMHLASDHDHWVYIGSNGAIAAGRGSPAHALFPYYTQDKVFDMAGSIGPLTLVRVEQDGGNTLWQPFRIEPPHPPQVERRLLKSNAGTKVVFEERNEALGLHIRSLWSVSRRFGFIRRVQVVNTGAQARTLRVLDGIQNIMPAGLTDSFQNQFSNLADAYKRNELQAGHGLALYYLNSVPTDRAEPNEGLRCTAVWSYGLDRPVHLLSTTQVDAFKSGGSVTEESETRGLRGAYLLQGTVTLAPGEAKTWWIAADIDHSAADVSHLQKKLSTMRDPAAELQAEIDASARRLQEIVGTANGIQCTADELRCARHYANTLYNVMRGGTFLHGYNLSTQDLVGTLGHFNRQVADAHRSWLEGLPAQVELTDLLAQAQQRGDPQLLRLLREYLPLVYSRRHGDPSRPWNRFSIELTDSAGNPRFFYQGNWRDIFQNWEALLLSFPEYAESAIFRFVNASTADGHNPYRVSKDGFDWEVLEPDEPWSNIGYWGDHQIIYLLKLLELSYRHHPRRLLDLLSQRLFAYAHVPYRIRHFDAVLADPRNSILYSDDDVAAISQRERRVGADGKLLPAPDGSVYLVNLAEKLLVPLLAKLASLVPGGGIWMNTQRPEWNDANNALAGYGLSVVTLGYIHRYLRFLEDVFADAALESIELSAEVARWLEAQGRALAHLAGNPDAVNDPAARQATVRELGASASDYRSRIYNDGFSGQVVRVNRKQIAGYLTNALEAVAASLQANRRKDRLFHSYNTLCYRDGAGMHVNHLDEMLEGQVSILSARLLSPAECADLLDSLQASRLRTKRLGTYLLYPDKDLPRFMERNQVPEAAARRIGLLAALLDKGDRSIVELDADWRVRFNGDLRNASTLRDAIARLKDPALQDLIARDTETTVHLFEDTFSHRNFTGRSSSFFAYEGLGSVYWHMVSKLVLAVQENCGAARELGATAAVQQRLAAHYRDALDGLGMHKGPEVYGAFPSDPYSHTPKHAGAQQPGMTGQVKEDVISRFGELGVHVEAGCIRFAPVLLGRSEFIAAGGTLRYFALDGQWRELALPPQSLAFTYCQIPVVYKLGAQPMIEITLNDGSVRKQPEPTLDAEESAAIFAHRSTISQLVVTVPEQVLAK